MAVQQDPSKVQDLYFFEEASPFVTGMHFQSECPPDKKVKVEDLFKFSRSRGDLQVSIVAAMIALFFLAFFWTQTGWDKRKLPDEFGIYLAHQFGLVDIEGRITRFGRILKQSWVAPLLCLVIFVPAALWNLRASWKETAWRKRFLLPTSAYFELTKYVAALEFVAYFIGYTVIVPILGYLLSTLILGDVFNLEAWLSRPALGTDRVCFSLCRCASVSHVFADQNATGYLALQSTARCAACANVDIFLGAVVWKRS